MRVSIFAFLGPYFGCKGPYFGCKGPYFGCKGPYLQARVSPKYSDSAFAPSWVYPPQSTFTLLVPLPVQHHCSVFEDLYLAEETKRNSFTMGLRRAIAPQGREK